MAWGICLVLTTYTVAVGRIVITPDESTDGRSGLSSHRLGRKSGRTLMEFALVARGHSIDVPVTDSQLEASNRPFYSSQGGELCQLSRATARYMPKMDVIDTSCKAPPTFKHERQPVGLRRASIAAS